MSGGMSLLAVCQTTSTVDVHDDVAHSDDLAPRHINVRGTLVSRKTARRLPDDLEEVDKGQLQILVRRIRRARYLLYAGQFGERVPACRRRMRHQVAA